MSLKDIPFRLSYKSKGKDNLLENFLLPGLMESVIYKRSVGFFSSSVFEIIDAGLDKFIENGGSIKIICSPELSQKDIEAIRLGYELRNSAIERVMVEDLENCLNQISDENIKTMVGLIQRDRLNIMVADVDDQMGIYHDKFGLLEDSEGNKVLFVGSANESKNAYCGNYEKIRISVSWIESDFLRIQDDEEEFDTIWNGTHDYISRIDYTGLIGKHLHSALIKRGLNKDAEKKKGDIDNLLNERINIQREKNDLNSKIICNNKQKGEFEHQKRIRERKVENIGNASAEVQKYIRRIELMETVSAAIRGMLTSETKEYSKMLKNEIQNLIDSMLTSKREVFLNEDFQLQVKDSYGDESKSEGQFAVISFAYIGGILKVLKDHEKLSGKEYPLILDGPFSKLDDEQKRNVVTEIPRYAPQVVIFSKDPLEKFIDEGVIGKTWTIQSNDEKNYAVVREGYLWKSDQI